MRRSGQMFFGLLVLGFLGWTVAGLATANVLVKTAGSHVQYAIKVDRVDFDHVTVDGKDFLTVRLNDTDGYQGILYREGYPEIPAIRFFVDTPPVIDIISSKEEYRSPEEFTLKPSQPSHPKIVGASVPFVMNEAVYGADAYWPEKNYEITDAGSVNGKKQYLVSLYPFSYNPVTNSYRLYREFSVNTTKAISSLAVSKPEIFAFIVGKKFSDTPSLKAYQDFKRSLGYVVKNIVMGSEISTPDHIRKQLKQLYVDKNFTLKYALIIGDAEDVPGFKSSNISGITDHYYRAIDTDNYESDINGPDIGVGRISVSTEAQLAIVLAKYTKYQKGVFSNEAWLKSMSFLASDDGTYWEVAEATHNYVIDTYTAPAQYFGNFPKPNQLGGDKLYSITYEVSDKKVQEAVRAGRTIVNYSGHGGPSDWMNPSFTQSDVRAIAHADALPFVIGDACNTGEFTVSESFGETWQRHDKGAIMYWGSMDQTFWGEDDVLERTMFDGIFQKHLREFSDITNFALRELWRYYGGDGKSKYYWETYVTFADPSILWRSWLTRSATVDGPRIVPAGVSQVEYGIFDENGKPISNVRVALASQDWTKSQSDTTDSDGFATFDLSPLTSSANITEAPWNLIVYGDNLRLGTLNVQIADAANPFLKISDVAGTLQPNRRVYVGETVDMSLVAQNIGHLATQGGSLQFDHVVGSVDMNATNVVSIPSLQPGERFAVKGGLAKFKVRDNAAPNEPIKIRLHWKLNDGSETTFSSVFRASRAETVASAIDAGQNTLGTGLKPGATGPAYVTIRNIGNEAMKNAALTPMAGTCLSQAMGELHVNELGPGESLKVATPIQLTASSSCKDGDAAILKLKGFYQSEVQNVLLPEMTVSFRLGIMTIEKMSFDNLDIPIPDSSSSATQMISWAKKGLVEDVSVHVKLRYSGFSDNLKISLVHPSGAEVILLSKVMVTDLDLTFGMDGKYPIKDIAKIKGLVTQGEWKLVVHDISGDLLGDMKENAINFVEMKIKGYFR